MSSTLLAEHRVSGDGSVPSGGAFDDSSIVAGPLRRVARTFAFPEITRPGVYVIDFIGGGKSSRALVRKGRLRPVVAMGTAGQVVTVVDETNTKVPDAMLWLNGQEYTANKDARLRCRSAPHRGGARSC